MTAHHAQNGTAETKGNLKLSKALLVQAVRPRVYPPSSHTAPSRSRKIPGIILPSEVKIVRRRRI